MTNKTNNLSDLATLVETAEVAKPITYQEAASASAALREASALVHQNRMDRVSYYFDEFVKNEGEQLNHPVKLEDQLQNRARYVLTHRAIQDACILWGSSDVVNALVTAWWNDGNGFTKIPMVWKPFVAVLIETAEQFYREEIMISDKIRFE